VGAGTAGDDGVVSAGAGIETGKNTGLVKTKEEFRREETIWPSEIT
jgi:hypothetical protein